MSKLKLYQFFHNKDTYELCSKDPRIIKVCIGYIIGGHKGLEGNFVVANEGKYLQNTLVDYPGYYYAHNHIEDEEYLGFTTYRHGHSALRTKTKPEDILDLDLDRIFKEEGYHLVTWHPWDRLIDHDFDSGIIGFIVKWLVEDMKIDFHKIDTIYKLGNEKTLFYRNVFILPVSEFREYFSFLTRFIEYIDRNYGVEEYPTSINIGVALPHKGWIYICERIPSIWLLCKYGRDLKIKSV